MRPPFHGYCESTVCPLGYGYDTLCMCGHRGWSAPSFFLCFPFVSLPQILHQNWHVTTSLHFLLFSSSPLIFQLIIRHWHIIAAFVFLLFQLCTTDTVMEQMHHCCISFSSFSSSSSSNWYIITVFSFHHHFPFQLTHYCCINIFFFIPWG